MTLAAHEDKTFRGASVASPSMPWVWGQGLSEPSDAYHLVWSRDLYQIATALLAAGDRAGAMRASQYLFDRQQKPDGCFPQNSTVDGQPKWTNLQLDEVAFPIVLAWQLGRRDAATYAHVKSAVGCLLANGPRTPQERWENQDGYSPATIASEIAGLVTAADLAKANHDGASADGVAEDRRRLAVQGRRLDRHEDRPLLVAALLPAAEQDTATRTRARTTTSATPAPSRSTSARSPTRASSSSCASASSPRARRSCATRSASSTSGSASTRPTGASGTATTSTATARRRTARTGTSASPSTRPRTGRTTRPSAASGRSSRASAASTSCSSGDRAAGARAPGSIAATAGPGHMIAEQVWDQFPPSGSAGFPRGEATLSAQPLAWSHAQLVRLAWSVEPAAGRAAGDRREALRRLVVVEAHGRSIERWRGPDRLLKPPLTFAR